MPILVKPTDTTKGQISDLVLSDVQRLYGFDHSCYVLPIVPMNGRLVVLNAKSETTSKAVLSHHDQQFLLKQVPWYCSNRLFVEFMLAFQAFLYQQRFPVPEVISSGDGDLFVEINNEFYYLQRFVSGNIYTGQPEEIVESGVALGRLHRLSEQYAATLDVTRYGGFRESAFHLAITMVEVLEGIVRSNQERLPASQADRLFAWCHAAKLLALQLETSVKASYLDDTLQVHGDYNPFNLMYTGSGRVAYAFDLENTTLDNPAHDVAEGLLDFCFHIYRPYSTRFERLPAALNADAARRFLNGYAATNAATLQRIAPILPAVVGATLIELVTLGVVRSDYDFTLMQDLPACTERMVAEVARVIDGLRV